MCLIAFAINASTRWPLVIAANRDEFLNRPTLPLGCWQTESGQDIISGRDLRAGGTWLGMTPTGRVAFLTNVREAQPQAAPRSRGELVTRWLTSNGDAASFVAELNQDAAAYGGFNLVLGDFPRQAWTWVTNKFAGQPATTSALRSQSLAPGVYGLSNAALNTPWPKTRALTNVLASALASNRNEPEPDALQAPLWTALADRERAPRQLLPATGVPLALEEALSSAFVDFPEIAYGTRSSTLLLVSPRGAGQKRHWEAQMEERTYVQAPTGAGASSAPEIGRPQVHHQRLLWRHSPAFEPITAA